MSSCAFERAGYGLWRWRGTGGQLRVVLSGSQRPYLAHCLDSGILNSVQVGLRYEYGLCDGAVERISCLLYPVTAARLYLARQMGNRLGSVIPM